MKNFASRDSIFYRTIGSGIIIVLLILSAAIIGCNSEYDKEEETKEETKEQENCSNSEHVSYQTIIRGSAMREYILHIPTSYDSEVPTPLIINYHGFGDCASDFARNVGEILELNSVADDNNFIVAYPQAVLREKGAAYWEPGDSGTQDIVENDAYFTEQLISQIGQDYNVDGSRVYATGYSNGGMMAYGLACSRSDLVAAIGIMSGIMISESCNQERPTSIIHFHGIADEVLPYQGNQDYQSVSEVINFWLNHNNILSSSLATTELNGGNALREEYTSEDKNTSVVLYTINIEYDKEGGHVWFSEDIEDSHPNQILWDFLSNYSL